MADDYSDEQLYSALRNADAAGDKDSAAKLSAFIAQRQAGGQETPEVPAVAQNNSVFRLPLMAGSELAKGAVNLAGVPGDFQDLLNRGGNALRPVLGGKEPSLAELQAQKLSRFPTSNELTGNITDLMGLTNRPDLQPTTPLERYGSATIGALPAAAATVATGGTALPALATTVLPALAGQGAHDLAPESRWAPVVAGLATGLGVGGVVSTVQKAAEAKNALKLVADSKQALHDARDAAFTGRKSLSDSVDAIKTTSAADFAATRKALVDAKDAVHGAADQAIETVASGFGKSGTLQEAGQALQAHARNWLNKVLPAKLTALWEPVNNVIPKDARFSLSNFQHGLKEINTDAGELEAVAGSLKPAGPKILGSKMESALELKELSGTPDGFSWSDMQKLRSNLGDAMSNPMTVKDIGAQNLSKLYATLTADMERAAKASGVGEAFDAANIGSSRLYGIAEGPMARIVASGKATAEDPVAEAVAKNFLTSGRAGATDLGVLRTEIPKGIDELAAAGLRTNPSGWGKLAPETRVALDPKGSGGATVLGALESKAQAGQHSAAGIKLAQQQHQANVDAARLAAKEGNFQHAGRIRSSQEALEKAKTAHSALPRVASSNTHTLQGILGTSLGSELAVLGLNSLGFHGSDLVHGAAGGVAGAMAPMVWRGATNLLKEPQRLVYPALGAETGGNALRPVQ